MNITKTDIQGLIIIEPQIFKDSRGAFFESWNAKKFKQLVVNEDFVQDNQSVSSKGVLRGLHFQNPPYAQAKLVSVIKGSVLDVVVDLRENSLTYGMHFSVILSEENNKRIFIPKGFAHGFLALDKENIIVYGNTNYRSKNDEQGILWNDKNLSIRWPKRKFIISQKDKNNLTLNEFNNKKIRL